MSLAQVRAAACSAVLAVPDIADELFAWDNAKFDPEGLASWIRVSVHVGEGQPVTLGSDGEDNFAGSLMLLLHQRADTGESIVMDYAEKFRRHFWVGRSFTSGQSAIVIDRNGPRPGYQSGAWWTVPFVVTFYSRLNRQS